MKFQLYVNFSISTHSWHHNVLSLQSLPDPVLYVPPLTMAALKLGFSLTSASAVRYGVHSHKSSRSLFGSSKLLGPSVYKTSSLNQHFTSAIHNSRYATGQFAVPSEQWAQVVEKSGGRKSPRNPVSILTEYNPIANINHSSHLQENPGPEARPR